MSRTVGARQPHYTLQVIANNRAFSIEYSQYQKNTRFYLQISF